MTPHRRGHLAWEGGRSFRVDPEEEERGVGQHGAGFLTRLRLLEAAEGPF